MLINLFRTGLEQKVSTEVTGGLLMPAVSWKQVALALLPLLATARSQESGTNPLVLYSKVLLMYHVKVQTKEDKTNFKLMQTNTWKPIKWKRWSARDASTQQYFNACFFAVLATFLLQLCKMTSAGSKYKIIESKNTATIKKTPHLKKKKKKSSKNQNCKSSPNKLTNSDCRRQLLTMKTRQVSVSSAVLGTAKREKR